MRACVCLCVRERERERNREKERERSSGISNLANASPWTCPDVRASDVTWPLRFSVGATRNCTWIFQIRLDLIVILIFLLLSVWIPCRRGREHRLGRNCVFGPGLAPPVTTLRSPLFHPFSAEFMPLPDQGSQQGQGVSLVISARAPCLGCWGLSRPHSWLPWAPRDLSMPLDALSLPRCSFPKCALKKTHAKESNCGCCLLATCPDDKRKLGYPTGPQVFTSSPKVAGVQHTIFNPVAVTGALDKAVYPFVWGMMTRSSLTHLLISTFSHSLCFLGHFVSSSGHALSCLWKQAYLMSTKDRKKRLWGKTSVPSCWGTMLQDFVSFVLTVLLFVLGLQRVGIQF